MAINIIKEGVLPQNKEEKYRGTCNHCQCQVEVSDSDIMGNVRVPYIKCPTKDCPRDIILSKVGMRVQEAV